MMEKIVLEHVYRATYGRFVKNGTLGIDWFLKVKEVNKELAKEGHFPLSGEWETGRVK